jgi:thiamine-phosphate pyrophosphorylase
MRMPHDNSDAIAIWRIIDANLNRVGEGLRFLEEVARLALGNSGLTDQLKGLRHILLSSGPEYNVRLLEGRDSVRDVGIPLADAEVGRIRNLASLVIANSRRVQEALRVLEELGKIPGAACSPDQYKEARFRTYTLEQDIMFRLLRQDKALYVKGVHLIIENITTNTSRSLNIAQSALQQGVRVVRLQGNSDAASEWLSFACTIKEMCRTADSLFIVGSRLDLALAANADGLHLEPTDLAPSIARSFLPLGALLGATVANPAAARASQADGTDYVECRTTDLAALTEIAQAIPIPLVAAINPRCCQISQYISSGALGISVNAAELNGKDIEIILACIIKEKEGKK